MQLDDQVAGLNMNQNLLGNADSRDWGIKKKDLPADSTTGRGEMKTFFTSLNAKSVGAIDRHPHDASDEKGLTLCVIGNSRGTLTDEACEKAIAEKKWERSAPRTSCSSGPTGRAGESADKRSPEGTIKAQSRLPLMQAC